MILKTLRIVQEAQKTHAKGTHHVTHESIKSLPKHIIKIIKI